MKLNIYKNKTKFCQSTSPTDPNITQIIHLWAVFWVGFGRPSWSGTNLLAKQGEVGQICLLSTSAQHEW